MKAINFKEVNVTYAEDQPEYIPLQGHRDKEGTFTCCMELDPEEIEHLKNTRILYIQALTFKKCLQPVRVSLIKEIPIPYSRPFMYTPGYIFADSPEGLAIFMKGFEPSEVTEILKTGVVWISIRTFGRPLQPFNMSFLKP